MVENGGLPQAAPPPPHRRRFKLDSPASDVAWPRTAALTAAGMVLALMLAVTVPGTRLSGVVGTAAKHLTTTSLSYLTGAIPIQLGLAANGSSGEDGGSDSSEMVDISENSSSDDSGGSSAEPGSEGSSGVAEPESEGSSGDAEPEGEESSGGGEPKGEGSSSSEGHDSGAEAEGEQDGSADAGTSDAAAEDGGGDEEADGSSSDGGEAEPDLPCRESGYCSLGKLQAYVGEVDSTEGLKAALEACSYKKDFFLLTIGSGGHLLGMNFVAGAWKLGLANVMLHATGNESCAVLAEAGYNNVTCVWSDRDWFPTRAKYGNLSESTDIWAVRYILMARAVWLGYNVWLLDTDSYLYRDPYKYVKVPPYKDIKWMTLSDNGATLTNGGASYIQNAAPGGGAAWTIAYAAERMIRVNEDWKKWAANANISDDGHLGHAMMDQFVLADAMGTNRLRHPYVEFTLPMSPGLANEVWERLQYGDPGVQLKFPPEWVNLTGSLEVATEQGFNLTIPHINGKWDAEIGGQPYPPRGKFALAFIKTLEEESGHKYEQIEGPTREGWVPPPNETFIFSPEWLVGTWLGRRMGGFWDLQPPAQVAVHVMFMPGEVEGPYQKEYGMKAVNAFNFDVSQALHGQLFPTATPEQPLPRVLALAPGLYLSSTTRQEFRDKQMQLVRLAMRVGRVMLLPDPLRNTTWTYYDPGDDDVLGHKRTKSCAEWVMLKYGLDDDQHCVWWPLVDKRCMPGTYITHPDYRELVRRLPDGTGEPGPDNTVQLDGLQKQVPQEQAANQTDQADQAGAAEQQASSWAAVVEAAKQKEEPHILFLSAIPDLTPGSMPPEEGEEDKRWKEWRDSCSWTSREWPEPTPERRRLDERRHAWRQAGRLQGPWQAHELHVRSEQGDL